MKPVLLASAACLLAGCPLLEVEVEIAEVCVTYTDVRVDGFANELGFVVDDLSEITDLLDDGSELEFVRADLRATAGVADFSFVESAHVTIASGDPESALPTLDVIACSGDCLADGTSLAVPAAVQANAIAYVRSGSLVVGIAMTGTPPADGFTMDVDVCMRGNVRYSLGE